MLPSIDLVRVRNGNATAVNVRTGLSEVSARARGFLSMLEKFQDRVRRIHVLLMWYWLTERRQLPDVDFPINSMAEGRILVPYEQRVQSNASGKCSP